MAQFWKFAANKGACWMAHCSTSCHVRERAIQPMRRPEVAGRTRNSCVHYAGSRRRPPRRVSHYYRIRQYQQPQGRSVRRLFQIFLPYAGLDCPTPRWTMRSWTMRSWTVGSWSMRFDRGAATGSTSQPPGRHSALRRCGSTACPQPAHPPGVTALGTADLVQPGTTPWRDSSPAPCTRAMSGALATAGTPRRCSTGRGNGRDGFWKGVFPARLGQSTGSAHSPRLPDSPGVPND